MHHDGTIPEDDRKPAAIDFSQPAAPPAIHDFTNDTFSGMSTADVVATAAAESVNLVRYVPCANPYARKAPPAITNPYAKNSTNHAFSLPAAAGANASNATNYGQYGNLKASDVPMQQQQPFHSTSLYAAVGGVQQTLPPTQNPYLPRVTPLAPAEDCNFVAVPPAATAEVTDTFRTPVDCCVCMCCCSPCIFSLFYYYGRIRICIFSMIRSSLG